MSTSDPQSTAPRRIAFAIAIAWAFVRATALHAETAGEIATPRVDAAPRAESDRDAPVTPRAIREQLRLAEEARVAGDRSAEFAHLARVIEIDSAHSLAHARLAEITGPAPEASRPLASDERIERALAHPYDPAALVAAGEALALRGEVERAIEFHERAVWLADLDPEAGLTAIRRLYVLDFEWAQRRIVPVQLHVDAPIRERAGWEFQMRTLWSSASAMLDGALATRFVPILLQPFDSSRAPNDLDAIYAAFLSEAEPPVEGIFAAVTGRRLPSGDEVFKKGVAEFLGRSLAVRLEPGAIRSRVLAHEILHLYGAIHVPDGVDTLMNPTGESRSLDAPNARIARALRGREFGSGGIEENVIPWIDLGETIAAFRVALSANLSARDAELENALRDPRAPQNELEFRIQRATHLDVHLADAARIVAALMLSDAQRADALRLLELSSQLYGPSSARGRQTAQQARRLRETLEAAADPPRE